MIWKIVVIILCLLWWLPIVYMWLSMKQIKKLKLDYEDAEEVCECFTRMYRCVTKEAEKEFVRLDNHEKIVNGWEHKIRILDEDVRKLKKELSKQKE